jgi:hypothetical protein
VATTAGVAEGPHGSMELTVPFGVWSSGGGKNITGGFDTSIRSHNE